MAGAFTPTPKDAARALNRLTPDQFAQVCSEIGYPEVTLPGATQAARAAALVEKTKGRPDFAVLVRAINRVDPQAWRAVPARAAVSSLVYGLVAFVALLGIGGLALVLILSGAESTAELPPTPTETLAPSRTPVPTLTYTPPPTPVPSDTPTPSATPTPTRDPALASATRRPTATETASPTPPVSIIYPMVEPQLPHSGFSAYPGATVEFRWILRDVTLAPDEQYLMRLYDTAGGVVDSYLTADPWRFYPVPAGASGTFSWTVTVVKVDDQHNVIGPLSPESDPLTVTWRQ